MINNVKTDRFEDVELQQPAQEEKGTRATGGFWTKKKIAAVVVAVLVLIALAVALPLLLKTPADSSATTDERLTGLEPVDSTPSPMATPSPSLGTFPTAVPTTVSSSPTFQPTTLAPTTKAPTSKPTTKAPACMNDFHCPANSFRKPHRQCYDSFDDCKCVDGFKKQHGHCVRKTCADVHCDAFGHGAKCYDTHLGPACVGAQNLF